MRRRAWRRSGGRGSEGPLSPWARRSTPLRRGAPRGPDLGLRPGSGRSTRLPPVTKVHGDRCTPRAQVRYRADADRPRADQADEAEREDQAGPADREGGGTGLTRKLVAHVKLLLSSPFDGWLRSHDSQGATHSGWDSHVGRVLRCVGSVSVRVSRTTRADRPISAAVAHRAAVIPATTAMPPSTRGPTA